MSGNAIAVIGAFGQVARALLHAGLARDQAIAIGGRPVVNLTAPASLDVFLDQTRPSVVINAAAYTAVDKAETEPDAAFALNASGPQYLASWCARRGVPLIQISTDYVFDGTASVPYREDDARGPMSVYGRSKAAGEEAVRAALPEHIIVRTAWVFGPEGQNFLKTMLKLGAERDVVRVVADQTGTPTHAGDIANALLDIASAVTRGGPAPAWGTYHMVAGGVTTWHGFAEEIFASAARLGLKTPKLEAITTADYPTPAARPRYSVLDTTKLRETFGIALPNWRTRVDPCVRQLVQNGN
ncbi:MAG: dTDP-4-dehydrorhamnose reductase [Hyphomicrobium sp.]